MKTFTELMEARKICAACDGGIMRPQKNQSGQPVYSCLNCLHEIPRRAWKSKIRKAREANIAATLAKLTKENK